MNREEYVKNYPWVKELRRKEEVIKAAESLDKASHDLHMLMIKVEKINPEYYEKLLTIHKAMNSLHTDLRTQFDGYITWA